MPELAEVYFHAGKWKAWQGQSFSLLHVARNKRCCRSFDVSLGRKEFCDLPLTAGFTHGKRMLFQFGVTLFLEVHLGMTGSLRAEANWQELAHDHLVLKGGEVFLVFNDPRQFGRVALSHSQGIPTWWEELPPEPGSARFDFPHLQVLCRRRSKAVIKSFLLVQDSFPGIGNWMADEILWQARIDPRRRVGSLSSDELALLYKKVRYVSREAVKRIGSDYSDPPASWLFRHRWKDGGVCPKTGRPLVRETIGGRTTCWSPHWQL